MGVPGFFLWLWKKYKGSNFVFSKSSLDSKNLRDLELINKIKNIDEFLLDLNCAIHPMCFKILDEYPNITNIDKLETKMMDKVVTYINELIEFVDPF